MKIDVRFVDNQVDVVAYMDLKGHHTKQFTFILNDLLAIEEVVCNGKVTTYREIEKVTPTFRALSQRIVVESDCEIEKLIIRYKGCVSGWHNAITDEIRALSWYSVWYPQEVSHPLASNKVCIYDCEAYEVVKGVYDAEKHRWLYGDCGYDPYNIVAYRRDVLKKVCSSDMTIYYVDEAIGEVAQGLEKMYSDVLKYYNGHLFEKREVEHLDVACLAPAITRGGAYKRKDLIVCDTLGSEIGQTLWMLAHEVAHTWCSGADVHSWEDWLNEGTAEWSWILYAIEKKEELFETFLKPKLSNMTTIGGVRTEDGKRLNDTHDRSTGLFYAVYQVYGKEIVFRMIQEFVKLTEKTTECFLEAIKENISVEVASFVASKL